MLNKISDSDSDSDSDIKIAQNVSSSGAEFMLVGNCVRAHVYII